MVENVAGQPVIRWRGVLAMTLAIFLIPSCFTLLLLMFARGHTPPNAFVIAACACMLLIIVVVAVEEERHAILLGSRCFRLSLAGMLIVVTLISIGLGALVAERQRSHQRSLQHAADCRALESSIRELTGAGTVSVQGNGITCQVTRSSFSDADLQKLVELAHLRGRNECLLSHLSLSGTAITDVSLASLGNLQSLTHLDVSGTAITDAGLWHVSDCLWLGTLKLDNTQVSSKGLAELKNLPRLQHVSAAGTPLATDPAAAAALPGVVIGKQ